MIKRLTIIVPLLGLLQPTTAYADSTAIVTCMKSLIASGISETAAATACAGQQSTDVQNPAKVRYYQECVERKQWLKFSSYGKRYAINGYFMGYGYTQQDNKDISDDKMKELGLWWEWSMSTWLGNKPVVYIRRMSIGEAKDVCRNEVKDQFPNDL